MHRLTPPLWTLLWAATPGAALAQIITSPTDTALAVSLQEAAVKARPVLRKTDGYTFIPSGEKRRASTSGLDLLTRLQLPRISVNPLTGGVVLSGGGTVRLCINGVEATSAEVTALKPADIIRVEYHDRPGARYSGADAVIDFIVRHHDSGGSLAAEGMEAVGHGKWATMDNVAASYNRGASSLAFNAGLFGLHRDNWVRDYEETWMLPSGPLSRTERGLPVSIGSLGLDLDLSYALQKDRVYYFNAKLGLDHSYVPNKEEGDRHTLLTTSASDALTEIREHTQERGTSPSLGLFYRRYLAGGQSITASASGSTMRSSSVHSYSETTAGAPATGILSDVTGRKHTVLAEAYYERRAGASRLTAGARHAQSVASNDYAGSETAHVVLRQSQSDLFGEYDTHLGPVGLLVGLTASQLRSSQAGAVRQKYTFSPAASLSYEPVESLRLRYDARLYRRQPSLSAMNDVTQQIQPGLVRRGNPSLRSFSVIDQQLGAGYTHSIVSADLLVGYRDERHPVMPVTTYDGRQFVTTYANQRAFRELRGELQLTVRPWADHLSIALSPSLSRYFSYGLDYTHVRHIFHLGMNLDFTYGHWLLSGSVMTGGANGMYGEELIREKDMNMIAAGYKSRRWSVQAGVFNAFMSDYWMKSENLSALTPYTSRAHCSRNAYGLVKFSLSLDFGHKHNRPAGPDMPEAAMPSGDTGIMGSTKQTAP